MSSNQQEMGQWCAQWDMGNSYVPIRTLFHKSLPTCLYQSRSEAPPVTTGLTVPPFKTVYDYKNSFDTDTKNTVKKLAKTMSRFFADAKSFVEANARLVVNVDSDTLSLYRKIGFLPSLQDLLRLWASPALLVDTPHFSKLWFPEDEKLVVSTLSCIVRHSTPRLIDTVKKVHNKSRPHTGIQQVLRVLLNVAPQGSCHGVSQNTAKVCWDIVEELRCAIERKLLRGDIVSNIALASRVCARLIFSDKPTSSSSSSSSSIVLNKALLFHPDTFVVLPSSVNTIPPSAGSVILPTVENIASLGSPCYLGVAKWNQELVSALVMSYVASNNECRLTKPIDIAPEKGFLAFLPSRIPASYEVCMPSPSSCDLLYSACMGPSFEINSKEHFCVCPISLCAQHGDEAVVTTVSFEVSGDFICVKVGDTLKITVEGNRNVTVEDGYSSPIILHTRKIASNQLMKYNIQINYALHTVLFNGAKATTFVRGTVYNYVYFAGTKASFKNVCVRIKTMCKYNKDCAKINDPIHTAKYYHNQ